MAAMQRLNRRHKRTEVRVYLRDRQWVIPSTIIVNSGTEQFADPIYVCLEDAVEEAAQTILDLLAADVPIFWLSPEDHIEHDSRPAAANPLYLAVGAKNWSQFAHATVALQIAELPGGRLKAGQLTVGRRNAFVGPSVWDLEGAFADLPALLRIACERASGSPPA